MLIGAARAALVFVICSFCPAAAAAEDPVQRVEIPRGDGSTIDLAVWDRGRGAARALILIGGSDCLRNERRAWFGRVLSDAPTRWVVSVDKEGAGDDPDVCADAYERTSLEAQRALDHVRAAHWLRRNLSLDESPAVDVMAISAGGNAACALAGASEEVASLMLLSTGGGRPFDVDMRAVTEGAGTIASQLDRVEQSPRIGETWLGDSNPEIWWWSALPLTCAPQMAGWGGPVLILQGSDDSSIPAESSRLLARQLEDHPGVTVDYRELPGAGHDLFIGAARKPEEGDGLTQALEWLAQSVSFGPALNPG